MWNKGYQKLVQINIFLRNIVLELSKRVTRPNPARPTMGWPLSGSTQPDSLISELKKLEPNPTHHGLVGSLAHLIKKKHTIFFLQSQEN